MLDFLDGHQFAALAAYNAGPGNVQSWQPFPEDLDIFVAQIPLLEPREYIRRIYLNLANYREIYQ
jgi:soluble lytic murein transglycosylase